MARPTKSGLEWFKHDTDASTDEKVEALRLLYQNDGYAFYFILLERIYRTPTTELDISDAETRRILAAKVGLPLDRFEQILETALRRDLFDRHEYESKGVLTSHGMKRRAHEFLRKRVKNDDSENGQVSDAETSRKPADSGAQSRTEKTREEEDEEPEEEENTHSLTRASEKVLTAQAEAVYRAYPRQVGRPVALKKIRKALESITFENLLERTQKFAAVCKGREMRFIPHPSTWFYQERYNDDPSTWDTESTNGTAAQQPSRPTTSYEQRMQRSTDDVKRDFAKLEERYRGNGGTTADPDLDGRVAVDGDRSDADRQ